MNNILFYKSFLFRLLSFKHEKHSDNSMGIDCHFLARMRKGHARLVSDRQEEMLLEAGDVFYLPMGLRYHSYWFPIDGAVEWESYLFTYFPCSTGAEYAMQKLSLDKDTLSLLDRLSEDMTVNASTVGLLYEVLGRLLPTMREMQTDPQQELLAKAKEYISTHTHFQISDLARHCGISESGLYAFFRSYAHTTPIEVKNTLLVEKAVLLLTSTDLSVEEISERVGIQTTAYFRKLVKEKTGKTPTQIRKDYVSELVF